MFYEKLTNLISEKGITLNKLTKEIGIAQSPTSRWKNGRMPNSETLIKICKYLHVSADYLLDLDDSPPAPQLSDQEERLLEYFRDCDDGTKKSVLLLASSGAAEAKRKAGSSTSGIAG